MSKLYELNFVFFIIKNQNLIYRNIKKNPPKLQKSGTVKRQEKIKRIEAGSDKKQLKLFQTAKKIKLTEDPSEDLDSESEVINLLRQENEPDFFIQDDTVQNHNVCNSKEANLPIDKPTTVSDFIVDDKIITIDESDEIIFEETETTVTKVYTETNGDNLTNETEEIIFEESETNGDNNIVNEETETTVTEVTTETNDGDDPRQITEEISDKNNQESFEVECVDHKILLKMSLEQKMIFISTATSKFKSMNKFSFPFPEKVFYRQEKSSEPSRRHWLIFAEQKLFCTVCMCFSSEVNLFISGFNDFRRTSQYVLSHEKSSEHNICVSSYLTNLANCNMNKGLLKMETVQRSQIEMNRNVLDTILNILKFISRQGLGFRGKRNEVIGDLNKSGNHGNFLELVKLVSNYNPNLKSHLTNCMEKSSTTNTSKGRGSLVTFLSNQTFNKLMDIMTDSITEQITNEINQNGGKFGIECDTTQDVSTKDQASIVVRYISDCSVQERLIAFKHSKDGSGKGMYSMIKSSLENVELKTGKLYFIFYE